MFLLLLATVTVSWTVTSKDLTFVDGWSGTYTVFVSDIAIFVLKRDVKLQLTNLYSLDVFLSSSQPAMALQ